MSARPLTKQFLLAGILILISGVLFFVVLSKELRAPSATRIDNQPIRTELFSGSLSDVSAFTIEKKSGAIILKRQGTATWGMEGELTAVADTSKVEELIGQVLAMQSTDRIVNTDEPLSDFGLDQPVLTLRITISGIETTLTFGSPTVSGNGHYVLLSSGKDIFIVDSYLVDTFTKEGNYFLQQVEKSNGS